MLTRLTIRNFKKFKEEVIELGNPVVFIGPNDSGKTSALQALALWEIGLKRWIEKRKGKPAPEKRPGVTINRRDLVFIPVREARYLWRNLAVRNVQRGPGGQQTQNIRIDVIVEGVSSGKNWTCGLEFDYANEESFHCRPIRTSDDKMMPRMPIPDEIGDIRIAYLPPMSGLASSETRLVDPGAINVRIGEGRTAEVLRNLCYQILTKEKNGVPEWKALSEQIKILFGVQLDEPELIRERGEIILSYRDRKENRLDIGCAGRGMQQTMLLLSYLASNRGAILLIDEPDAHLEILRQRQIYQVLSEWARKYDGQVVISSHSEIVLNEAAGRDVVVAFLGRAHRIDDRGCQVVKALREIGYDHYYQAEQKGWVIYLEGSTDLAILRAFARILEHPAAQILDRPFAEYIGNQPTKAYTHFYGLREAKSDLASIAIYDRLERDLEQKDGMRQIMWKKNEIENYITHPQALRAWAADFGERFMGGKLFRESAKRQMEESINEIESALQVLGKSPWAPDIKVCEEFLEPLFGHFFRSVNLPNIMQKSAYHELAEYMPKDEIDQEVLEVLDAIVETAKLAKPIEEE